MLKLPEIRILAFGFPLSLAWEFLQSPFYMDTFTELWTTVAYNRIHCSIGDVLILLAAFWALSLLWGRSWLSKAGVMPSAVFVIIGISYTILSEHYNVSVAQNWAYSQWMPMAGSIGVLPVVQWLLLPLLVLRLSRPVKSSNRTGKQ
ncbi:MAG: hypothetical protein HY695_07790 [Deltaproteobacteria bacterium]|nr:hypothetical protein [Deltaproteobacteria bacterium]